MRRTASIREYTKHPRERPEIPMRRAISTHEAYNQDLRVKKVPGLNSLADTDCKPHGY